MPPPPPPAPAGAPSVPLGGMWRAAVADESLRRSYPGVDFDDDDWEPLAVPGHWSSSPALAGTTGGGLHRRRFETPAPFGPGAAAGLRDLNAGAGLRGLNAGAGLRGLNAGAGGRRTWLVFDGVFYTSDVWLDGTYVGDTEGYFFPHAFEVTDALADRADHTLAIEVACPADGSPQRTLLGPFGPAAGGLWRPVRLEQSGPVRLVHLQVTCTEVTDEAATVAVRAVLDSDGSTIVEVRTTVAEENGDVSVAG